MTQEVMADRLAMTQATYVTSAEKDRDYLKFWISHTLPEWPVENAGLKELFFGGNRELILVELKCLEKTCNLIQVITYDKKGKIEKSENPAVKSEKVYPESLRFCRICQNQI